MSGIRGTRSRHHRMVSLAVAMLQFAAVTLVPVAHPFIHPDEPPPGLLNQVGDPNEGQDASARAETSCFICQAGQQFSAAMDQRLPLGMEVSWHLPINTTEVQAPPQLATPANAARAPPVAS